MIFTWATGSHRGRIRENNEDAVYPETGGKTQLRFVVAVADGMGGASAGEIASQMATQLILTAFWRRGLRKNDLRRISSGGA